MQPQINEREKVDINSNSYSLKLLTTIASPDALGKREFKKITNLQQLSNRLKVVNEGYKHKPNSIQTTKEWMNDEGIKFNNTLNLIEKARQQQSLPKPKVAVTSWNNIEYQSMKNLSFEEFVQQNEERVAYLSVMQSLSNRTHRKTNQYMKNIRTHVLNKLKGISDSKKLDNSTHVATEQTMTRNTLANIIEQGLDIDKDLVLKELHNRISKFFKGTHTHWIQLLSSQIQMINFLQQNGQAVDLISNFIYIVSLKSLQNHYEQLFKNRRLKRQEFLLFSYEKTATKDLRYWSQIFFYLRIGQIEKCVLLLKQNGHFELMEDLQNLEEKLNQFKIIEPNYQIEPNHKNTIFEKIIKLVLKGEYQPLFKELSKEIQLLDQPWFILLTLLIKRNTPVDRQRTKDAAIIDYFKSHVSKLQNSNSVISLLVGLLSLGTYDLVIRLYEELSITASNLEYDYFIHVFILITANSNLLVAMYASSLQPQRIQQILNVCLTQIVLYLKILLKTHSSHYNNYFRLLLQIIENLGQKKTQFSLKPCIKTLCRQLFPNVSSLGLLNSSKLSNLKVENMTNDIFFNQLLLNMTYRVDSEYFELADFCMKHNRPDIQQHILLSFVIKTEMQEQIRQRETIKNGVFDTNQNSIQKAKDVQTALNILQMLQTNNQQIILFLRELREVKILLRERRKVQITGRIKRIEKFRKDQRIVNYLENMQKRDGHSYFDIFVSYYDKLYQAYQIVYVALSKISTLKELSHKMIQELQTLRISYSSMNSDLYGRTVATLLK